MPRRSLEGHRLVDDWFLEFARGEFFGTPWGPVVPRETSSSSAPRTRLTSHMPSIAVTYNQVSYEVKRIVAALRDLSVEVSMVDDRKVVFPCRRGDFGGWGGADGWGSTDGFLVRSLSASHGYYAALVLEHQGFEVWNSARCLDVTNDKLKTTLALDAAGVPTPKTALALSARSALRAIEADLGYPCVVKPVVGSWGRLVARLDNVHAASAVLEDREVLGSFLHKVFYLQEYLARSPSEDPGEFPRDLRVVVVGGRALGAMGRFEAPGDFRSNVARGGRTESFPLSEEVAELSVRAAVAVGAEFAGVDLMHDGDDWSVIEVNGTPQFRGFESATGVDVGGEIARHVARLAKS
ncbi:MAG: hypothetical protein Kow0069_00030 [Promethearchaeota archaeon]